MNDCKHANRNWTNNGGTWTCPDCGKKDTAAVSKKLPPLPILEDMRDEGDYPEAAREYHDLVHESRYNRVVTSAIIDAADAAIAALQEELAAPNMDRRLWQARAEKAEYAAEENREAMNNAVAAWRQAEAEVAALKKSQVWHDWYDEAQRQAQLIKGWEAEGARAEERRKKMRDIITDYDDKLNASRAEVERLTWREHELHEFLNWKPQDAQDRYVYGEQQPKGSFKQVREFIDCLDVLVNNAGAVIPLNEDQAEAFKALSESIKTEQSLRDEVAAGVQGD